MQLNQFIKQYRAEWQRLEELTTLLQKNQSKDVIESFQHTYQKVSQQLAFSQTYFPKDEVTVYLNEIVSKAHNVLYQSEQSSFKQISYFISTKFVGLLLEQWKAIIVAMLLFAFGGLASFFAVVENPMHIYGILPEEMVQGVEPEQLGIDPHAVDASVMSAEIMTNNIQVAILAFAGGITFGILTVYLLIYNGILVGALAGLFWNHSNSYAFWAYIVPHGVVELAAIFIAGGAGLLMGYKLFVPGQYTRKYQLKMQAMRSVQLLLGTIPLFVIAGIIEGFITPANLSLEMKYFVAITTAVGLVVYMFLGHLFMQRKSLQQSTI
ncbi:stage II sporulation protein M [Gracilibacillus sp. YIM 98692]|uniref:stage II sporulation protein M n=1 Tax=Gracilibacillus sp. YIM 98692 TaxID=2663532 RepID=UPI0013D409D4|nr:stage II sporulation protein M [Gracilibacillus sp. YIM 98692]